MSEQENELPGWEELPAESVARLRSFDAWNRGDVEAWIDRFSPDGEWRWLVGAGLEGPEGATFHGREGLREFRREIEQVWQELRDVPERAWRRGHLMIVASCWQGRGRHSGVEVEMPIFSVSERDREGRSTWSAQYESLADALEAARHREASGGST